MRAVLSRRRILTARAVAVAADVVQLGLLPADVLAAPVAIPLTEVLDVAVAVTMVWLLGWHWAFLPTIVAEAVPVLDAVPTWTAAVLFATRNGATVPAAPAAPAAGEKSAGSGSTKPAA